MNNDDKNSNNDQINDANQLNLFKSAFQKVREQAGQIVEDHTFQLVIVVLIIINAITMGIATFDFVTDHPPTEQNFEIIDLVFLIIFTIEVLLNLLYHGPIGILSNGWPFFDTFVVVISWAFYDSADIDPNVMRSFRVLRVIRLFDRLPRMKAVIEQIVAVLPKLCAIMLLLAITLWIFAVLFTQMFG